jgi:hypothetical protein
MQVKIYNPQWNRDMDVDDQLVEFMHRAGFVEYHSGGGCMAWINEEPEFYTLITVDEVELGTWAQRDDKVWQVGRYSEEDSGVFLFFNQNVTLQRALEVARRIPNPSEGQTTDLIEDENGLLTQERES